MVLRERKREDVHSRPSSVSRQTKRQRARAQTHTAQSATLLRCPCRLRQVDTHNTNECLLIGEGAWWGGKEQAGSSTEKKRASLSLTDLSFGGGRRCTKKGVISRRHFLLLKGLGGCCRAQNAHTQSSTRSTRANQPTASIYFLRPPSSVSLRKKPASTSGPSAEHTAVAATIDGGVELITLVAQ